MIMKIILIFILMYTLIFAESIYDTQPNKLNKKAMENKKIKCRLVCDKKIYKEQKIASAISFYKNSKYYKFTKSSY